MNNTDKWNEAKKEAANRIDGTVLGESGYQKVFVENILKATLNPLYQEAIEHAKKLEAKLKTVGSTAEVIINTNHDEIDRLNKELNEFRARAEKAEKECNAILDIVSELLATETTMICPLFYAEIKKCPPEIFDGICDPDNAHKIKGRQKECWKCWINLKLSNRVKDGE